MKDDRYDPVFKVKIENDILISRYFSEHLTLEMAESFHQEKMRIAKGKVFPALFDYRSVKKMDREARAFISLKNSSDRVCAKALLVQNDTQELMGNMIIHFYRLKIPARIFRDEQEAIKWLTGFKV